MDVSRVSRNDWIIGGGFVLMFIGTVTPWYGYGAGGFDFTLNGWHGAYLGWLTFLLCLVAAAAVLRHLVPELGVALPVPDAVIALACGAVSALIVLIRLFMAPQEFGVHFGLRWGIFVSLVGALVVAVAGFLKYGEIGTLVAATTVAPSPAVQPVPPPPRAPQVAAPAAPAQAVAPPAPTMPAPPAAPAQAAPPPPAPASAAEDGGPAVEQSAAASPARFCIKCGSALPSPEARFCAKCGTPRQ